MKKLAVLIVLGILCTVLLCSCGKGDQTSSTVVPTRSVVSEANSGNSDSASVAESKPSTQSKSQTIEEAPKDNGSKAANSTPKPSGSTSSKASSSSQKQASSSAASSKASSQSSKPKSSTVSGIASDFSVDKYELPFVPNSKNAAK